MHAASRAGVAAAAVAAAIEAALRDDVDAEEEDAIAAVKDIVSEYGGGTELKAAELLAATARPKFTAPALAHTDTDTITINSIA